MGGRGTNGGEIVGVDMAVFVVVEEPEQLLDAPRLRVVLEHSGESEREGKMGD